jgi:transcriptional regulator with PAS, ATPase and Fis domain
VSQNLIGISAAISRVRDEIRQAAQYDAKVLVTGESGVGKEIVARGIHQASTRRSFPLVTVNCAALTDSLLETELFGHVQGSFTDAFYDRVGALESANRGTVFLDEVGETTPRMQGLLLRFLETGEIQRVGSDRAQTRVSVRVIAATNRELLDAISRKAFREDLYYRLNVIHIRVPPLRERREDIEPLFDHFLASFSETYASPIPEVAADLRAVLLAYHWPGNVRELRNVVERLVARGAGSVLRREDLPQELVAAASVTAAPAAGAIEHPSPDELYAAITRDGGTFWSVVFDPFMARDLTREDVRGVVTRGLRATAGNYKEMVRLFNLQPGEYKRFLAFLRKYGCHVTFQPFRTGGRQRGDGAAPTDSSDPPSIV